MSEQFDLRIGKHREYEPQVCAASGEHAPGRHSTKIHLGVEHYCFILAKHKMRMSKEEVNGIREELNGIIRSKSSDVPKSKASKAGISKASKAGVARSEDSEG